MKRKPKRVWACPSCGLAFPQVPVDVAHIEYCIKCKNPLKLLEQAKVVTDTVIFHLKRIWEGKDLWEEIKSGRKTSEWRDFSKYWIRRLCWKLRAKDGKFGSVNLFINEDQPQELTFFLKVHRAWFVVGYPPHSVPRLEADIIAVVHHPSTSQLEIKFTNAKERSAI